MVVPTDEVTMTLLVPTGLHITCTALEMGYFFLSYWLMRSYIPQNILDNYLPYHSKLEDKNLLSRVLKYSVFETQNLGK